jgi:hypothetical protein
MDDYINIAIYKDFINENKQYLKTEGILDDENNI